MTQAEFVALLGLWWDVIHLPPYPRSLYAVGKVPEVPFPDVLAERLWVEVMDRGYSSLTSACVELGLVRMLHGDFIKMDGSHSDTYLERVR